MYDEMHHDVRAPKPWIRWLLLLVILIFVLVVGYVIGVSQSQLETAQDSEDSSDVVTTQTPSVTTPSRTSDADTNETTADASLSQTFTHPYGYLVKYPAGWDYSKTDALETCFGPAADFVGGALKQFCISVQRVTVDQYIANQEISVVRQETVMINGVESTQVVSQSGGVESEYRFIPGNGIMYITRSGLDAEIEQKIINSFQIIDPTGDLSEVN